MEAGRFNELADPRLEGKYDEEELKRLVLIASYCIRSSPLWRPSMTQVECSSPTPLPNLKACLKYFTIKQNAGAAVPCIFPPLITDAILSSTFAILHRRRKPSLASSFRTLCPKKARFFSGCCILRRELRGCDTTKCYSTHFFIVMEENLGTLHRLLKNLHANAYQGNLCTKWDSGSFQFDIGKIDPRSITELSDSLFENLQRQFNRLHTFGRSSARGVVGLDSNMKLTKEGFILLLRCCFIMLHFMEFDMTHVLEKCSVLTGILGKICSPNIVCRSVSTRSSISRLRNASLDRNKLQTNKISFSSAILEMYEPFVKFVNVAFFGLDFSILSETFQVLLNEILENRELKRHLTTFESLTANAANLSTCLAEDLAVSQFVFSHFLLTVNTDLAFEKFVHALSGSSEFDVIPEISLDGILKLISIPSIFSAPHMLQAHLILMACRCVATNLPFDVEADSSRMTRYIKTFELSANLYLYYLSNLELNDGISGATVISNFCSTASDSRVHQVTWYKLIHQAKDLVDYFHHSHSRLFGTITKSEVIGHTADYIRQNLHTTHGLCKDVASFILNFMKRIPPTEVEDGHSERVQNEVFCLAAALKLMSFTLLQILRLWRQTGCPYNLKELHDCFPFKEHDSISGVMCCCNGFGADQQAHSFLFDIIGVHGEMHLQISMMLAHFTSLFLFSFRKRLAFLSKGCISMLMTLMNLIFFEKENLSVSKASKLPQSHSGIDNKGRTFRKSTLIIASNLRKTQMLCLREETDNVILEGNRPEAGDNIMTAEQNLPLTSGFQKNTNDTCNGECFIRRIPDYHQNPSEWEDLVDFIECKSGKDYSSWLKNLHRFNQWKHEKVMIHKIQKKKEMNLCLKRFNLGAKKRR
ncbi:putative receptor-like serine/threonine-protein kinase [Apostasia shenzhenica]|uniref:Putative receptor-like serine/threonine-protein kinase n=1 Tax=Apostasia shenzhenica TaxID=1088818 RepID=A0A2I0AT06_9ASPA|nr:putative receptor-like serine/threonine-protein kinase [Apostasia shenzhenica]